MTRQHDVSCRVHDGFLKTCYTTRHDGFLNIAVVGQPWFFGVFWEFSSRLNRLDFQRCRVVLICALEGVPIIGISDDYKNDIGKAWPEKMIELYFKHVSKNCII